MVAYAEAGSKSITPPLGSLLREVRGSDTAQHVLVPFDTSRRPRSCLHLWLWNGLRARTSRNEASGSRTIPEFHLDTWCHHPARHGDTRPGMGPQKGPPSTTTAATLKGGSKGKDGDKHKLPTHRPRPTRRCVRSSLKQSVGITRILRRPMPRAESTAIITSPKGNVKNKQCKDLHFCSDLKNKGTFCCGTLPHYTHANAEVVQA